MHKALSVLLLTAWLATGCQQLARPTPVPTPPPILLGPTETPTVGVPAVEPTWTGPEGSGSPASRQGGEAANAPSPAPATRTSPATPTAHPVRLMALGTQPTIVLRAAPDPAAQALATLPGSTVLWAEARSANGRWLWVTYDLATPAGDQPEGRAWVANQDVTLFGAAEMLPVGSPEALGVAPQPAEPTGPASASGVALSGRVRSDQLNVRAGPGLDQPVLGQLTAGESVTVTGRSQDGNWLAIAPPAAIVAQLEGGLVWVSAQYVEVAGDPASLSVPSATLRTGVGAASAPARAPQAAPALSGTIAFQTVIGGDIYIVNADGSGLRHMATGMDPALSPDGSRLAYARWDAPHGVFVLDLRTGQEQRVASATRPRSPAWSPDGNKLVFAHSTRSYVCLDTPFGCVDEDTVRQVFGGQDCIDTPQGRYCIADFRPRQVDDTGLVQVDATGGDWLDLNALNTVQSPQWHPSRNEILYRGPRGLQLTAPGEATRPLVEDAELSSPTWAPDGQRIAAQIYRHDHADIFLLDAAGNVQKRLTGTDRPIGRAANNVAPAWSPDGRYILFLSDRDGSWRLYRMNSDGTNQVPFLPQTLADIPFRYDFAAERVASWGR